MNDTMEDKQEPTIELKETIKWMQYRKMRRVAKSSTKPRKGSGLLWVIIFIAIYIASALEIAFEGLLSWVAISLLGVTMLWIIYFLYLSSTPVRFFLLWLFCGIFTYILTPSEVKQWVFVIVAVLEFLTIFGIIFRSYLFVRFYRAVMYHALRVKRRANNAFRYKSSLFPRQLHGEVTYSGALDKENRPHGYGMWTDSEAHGENLKGWWSHGRPQGPFLSRITGTVNTFIAVRIGFACTTKKWNKASCRIDSARGPLSFGVAVIECATSGKFSRHFPHVKLLAKPKPCNCQEVQDVESGPRVCNCLSAVLEETVSTSAALPTTELVVHTTQAGIDITGLDPAGQESLKKVTIEFSPASDDPPPNVIPSIGDGVAYQPILGPKLIADTWQHADARPTELLVFVGGYNSTLEVCLGRFAQLISMGNFPPRIKPIVFSWPNGTALSYCSALKQGARSEATLNDFTELLDHVRDTGIRDIHFLVHSMGAELFFRALETTKSKFCTVDNRDKTKLTMHSFVMMNPDFPERRFCQSKYEEIRFLCPNITLFADQKDTALFFSERFSCNRSLGRAIKPLKDGQGNLLDIDIINTTNITDNMHSLRHSNYSHNQAIVDDLRELIVFRRRAQDRTTKVKKMKGNVYMYLFSPTLAGIHE